MLRLFLFLEQRFSECWLWRTWRCRSRWCLQLSSCILNGIFVIFIAWIIRINSPQISGIFEFWFLDWSFLLLSSLSGFSNSRPSVRSYVIRTWCRLNLSRSFFQWNKSCESCPWIWQTFCFHRHSNSRQFVFLCHIQIFLGWFHFINVLMWNWTLVSIWWR